MFLTIMILKSFIELSLMFVVGRFILGLLAGAKRQTYVLTTDPLINRKQLVQIMLVLCGLQAEN